MSEVDELRAENARLKEELRQLTAGSAWKETIAKFLFQAELDDELQPYIDEKVRERMVDLVRTEEHWCEVCLALHKAKLRLQVRDGKVFVSEENKGAEEWLLEDLLRVGANA